jgi:hypothetical protein
MDSMMNRLGWTCLAVLVIGCGDDGGGSGGATDSGTGTTTMTATSPTATPGTTSTSPTEGPEGSGTDSVSATDNTPTTAPDTDTATTAGPTTTPDTDSTTTDTTPPATDSDPDTDSTTTPVSGTTTGTDTGTTDPPAGCGNGVLDDGEECDDGADNGPEAACYENCTQNVCGDGVVSPDEACDLGADNGPDNGCSTECALLPSSCGNQSVTAELMPSPVDVIIVVDNSSSMTQEIAGIQDNINNNFAQILEDSGLDYRVILLADYGILENESVCIEAPLSGTPIGDCDTSPPPQPINNPGKFYHYSREIASTDSWCQILRTVNGNNDDDYGLAADGWQEWLRLGSFKTFVELTDDAVDCTWNAYDYDDQNTAAASTSEAAQFDTDLRAFRPDHFGDPAGERNYRWYSIIGMPYNNPDTEPYDPADPIVTNTDCPGAQNAGPGHQALSILTGGLRFPLCNPANYGVVLQAIADGVIDSATIGCEFDIPDPPMGKTLDEDSVTVTFTPMGQNPELFMKVDDPSQCTPTSFYLEADKVILCPATCDAIQGNADAMVEVEFTCEPLVPN